MFKSSKMTCYAAYLPVTSIGDWLAISRLIKTIHRERARPMSPPRRVHESIHATFNQQYP
jgi:hypothetical protein